MVARKILVIVPEHRWDETLAKAQDEQFMFIPQREDFERHEPLQLIVKGAAGPQHVFDAEVLRVVPGKGTACLLLGGLEDLGDEEPVVKRALGEDALVVKPAQAARAEAPRDLMGAPRPAPAAERDVSAQDLLGQGLPGLPESELLDQFQDEPSPAPGSPDLAPLMSAPEPGAQPAQPAAPAFEVESSPTSRGGDEVDEPQWLREPLADAELDGVALSVKAPPAPEAEALEPREDAQQAAPEPLMPSREVSDDASEDRSTLFERIKDMTVVEKQRLALSASKTERTILIRDPLKQVHLFVLKNPRVRQDEVLEYAKYGGLAPQALKYIADNKTWMQSPQLRLSLVRNPNIPMESARLIMAQLQHMDLRKLMKSGAVRPDIRSLARKEAQKKGLIG